MSDMMTITRRDFIATVAMAAGGTFAGCAGMRGGESALTVNGLRIGVQMWSIADIWKKNPAEAFRRLKALGYDGVQSVQFFLMDPGELEKMLGDSGLQIVDMPFRKAFVEQDRFNEYVEFCKRFKVDFVYEPRAKLSTAAEWRAHAEWLASLAERFRPYGIRVGYHNHQHELREHYEGKTPMEFLYDAGLAMELDVGHVKLADGDPVRWLERLNGRVPSIHAKPGGGNSVGGEGDANDWPAIFAAAAASGTRWAVVECETRRNTYADVEASMAFLKGMKGAH